MNLIMKKDRETHIVTLYQNLVHKRKLVGSPYTGFIAQIMNKEYST